MAKKKRSAARAAAAAAEASKKAKPDVHEGSVKVIWPLDTSPQIAKLDAGPESIRALRTAEAAATEVLHIKLPVAGSETNRAASFELFAKPFGAAVASACAKWRRPVTLNEVITAIAETGCKLKIAKQLINDFVWKGFIAGRWDISRAIPGKGLAAYPKGAAMPCRRHSRSNPWRFSPSPAPPAGGPV